jgi:hypothetical protein
VGKTNTGAMQRAIAMQKEEPDYLDKERSRNFRKPQMRAFKGGLSENSHWLLRARKDGMSIGMPCGPSY